MRSLKRLTSVLLAAVLSASAALSAYAAEPQDNGTPTGAELLVTSGESTASDPPQDSTADTDTDVHTPPPVGSVDKTFDPVNKRNWTIWDGESEFLDNTDYYIYGNDGFRGEFTLPENSRLMIGEGRQFYVYSSDVLTIKGTLIVAPGGELITCGTLSLADGGIIENYGDLKFTHGSTVNVSSMLAAYGGSQTAFGGKTLVYGGGTIANFGTAFIPEYADTTITGKWRSGKDSMLYVNGNVTTTLNGTMEFDGYVNLQAKTRLTNSGILTIAEDVKYFKDENTRITNTKSGRIIDHRDPVFSAPTEEFKKGIKGIDVSVWQGAIDWKKVREAGVKFAIIRSSSGSRVDKLFDYNITEASKAGINVGVYHYCYAMTPEEAREEARHFIETIKPYRIDYPVMFDFEDNSQIPLGKEKLTEIAEVFLSEVKNAGYYPMIYSYRNWLELNLDMDRLSEYDVAVAEWGVTEPKYKGSYGIWQYSCKGRISGIEGDVDLDLCFRDYAKIIREGGFNKMPSDN